MQSSQQSQQNKQKQSTLLPLTPISVSAQPSASQKKQSLFASVPPTISTSSPMTIKQQETIEQILRQTLQQTQQYNARLSNPSLSSPSSQPINQMLVISTDTNHPHRLSYSNMQHPAYQLDDDIDKLLKQSQQKIQQQYQSMIQNMYKNRLSIVINDQHDKLKEIFQRMDARSQISNNALSISKSKQDAHNKRTRNGSQMLADDQAFNLDLTKLKHHEQRQARIRSYSHINIDSHNHERNNSVQVHDRQIQHSDDDSEQLSEQVHQPKHNNYNIVQHNNKKQPAYILDTFQHQQILNPKQQSLQILQLDQKYPKINPSSMYKHQYPIFKFTNSSVNKYLKYMKKQMKDIQCAVSFNVSNNTTTNKWTILAVDSLLYLFISQDWKQPIVINPHRTTNSTSGLPNINNLSVSKSGMYLAVALPTEIILYEVKKQSSSLVFLKNISNNNDLNTKVTNIQKVIIFNENPIKLCYLDTQLNVGVVTCQNVMMFMRVNEKAINHGASNICDFDVLMTTSNTAQPSNDQTGSPAGKTKFGFKLNQKLSNFISKPNPAYCALASRTEMMVYKIQPSIQLIYMCPHLSTPKNEICLRWRSQSSSTKSRPQLLISYNNKIYIYKLIQPQLSSNSTSSSTNSSITSAYIQLHLMYQNHYDIRQMEIISNTHLLLRSEQNIIVIAVPLIVSTEIVGLGDMSVLAQNGSISDGDSNNRVRRGSQCNNHDMFESAMVFISNQKSCRILHPSMNQILFYSQSSQLLRIATLVPLQSYLDQQMLQNAHFRQSFTLLILIHKGINYSFKFAYTSQALQQCIYSAVDCTISALKLAVGQQIIQYRIGWVVQLLVQTRNQAIIWSVVYRKLKEKDKERQKEWQGRINKIQQQRERKTIHESDSTKTDKVSYYQQLVHKYANDRLKSSQESVKPAKLHLTHTTSLILQSSTSNELLDKPPKSLQHVLFDILEVFVLKSQITEIPEEVFYEFINYQCEKMSDTVVEKAIIQSKQSYDGSKLLSLLHNKQRNYLQLYLFSRAIISDEPDFYTPFIKVFSSLKTYHDMMTQTVKIQRKQQIQYKINNVGLMCLWFLSKCFRLERIPSGMMPLNQKLIIVHTMCVQMLEPAFTRKLYEFNNKIFLQTYLLMFIGGELSMLLEQQNQVLVQKYKQFYASTYEQIMSTPPSASQSQIKINRKSQVNNDGQQIFDKSFKQLAILHIQRTIPMISNQKLLWAQFQALAFYYNKTQLCFTFQTTVDILIILFQNKFQQYNVHIPIKSTSTSASSSSSCTSLFHRPTIQQLYISLIDYIKPILLQKKDRFYISKLLSFNDKHIAYYLYRIDQNYRQALEQFLGTKQEKKIIGFIHQLLYDIKEIGNSDKILRDRKFADIKQFLVKNISLLFKIDKFQALNIFYEIGQTSQTIYSIIQQNMGNKLNFLSAVLKKFEHQDFQMKQRFQLEHLSQVCMLKNKQMLQYLQQFYYPLDQAIIVCEQKGNLLAKAIFEERCGRMSDAFMSYQRIVKGIIQSNNYKSKSEKHTKREVHKYTEQCLRLCKLYAYDPNSAPENNFWLRIITFINGFIKSNSQHKVFLKVEFEKVFQHILSQMFKFLSTTVLIDFFITKGHRLQLSMAKEFSIYQNLFMLVKFDINVQIKVLQICKLDIKFSRKQALQKRKTGIISQGMCDFCKKSLNQQQICRIYSCKHAFHKLCHEDMYRCITCYFESDNSLIKSNIFGSQIQKSMQQFDIELGHKSVPNSRTQLNTKPNIRGMDIVVQSAHIAKQAQYKKKMKVYDFNSDQSTNNFYEIIEHYSTHEKNRLLMDKMEEYENQYNKYSEQKGINNDNDTKSTQQEDIVSDRKLSQEGDV